MNVLGQQGIWRTLLWKLAQQKKAGVRYDQDREKNYLR